MDKSTEIRWFIIESDFLFLERLVSRGPFHRSFSTKSSISRKDIYLVFKHQNIGIKMRDVVVEKDGFITTKVEFKVKVGKELDTNKYSNITGTINSWTKHSFKIEKSDKSINSLVKNLGVSEIQEDWIEVKKERLLIKFDVHQKIQVPEQLTVKEGCGIELTKLMVKNMPYFTVGFEAYSETDKAETNLMETIEYFHNHFKPKGLTKENSMSYPEFLINLNS